MFLLDLNLFRVIIFYFVVVCHSKFVPPVLSIQARSSAIHVNNELSTKNSKIHGQGIIISNFKNICQKIESIFNSADNYTQSQYSIENVTDTTSLSMSPTSTSTKESIQIKSKESTVSCGSSVLSKASLVKDLAKLKGGKNAKKRITILMSDTGGGHRASAQALDQALQEQFPGKFECTITDIWTEYGAPPFNTFVPAYRFIAKHPLIWRAFYIYGNFPPSKWFTEWWSWKLCYEPFKKAINASKPDLVVSVHPLCQKIPLSVVGKLNAEREKIANQTKVPAVKIPFITVVTDLGGAHSTWFDTRADLTFVPSLVIKRTAIKNKLDKNKIIMRGLPVRPMFWKPADDKNVIRKKLGLFKNIKTVLFMGGGDGVGGMKPITYKLVHRLSKMKKSDDIFYKRYEPTEKEKEKDLNTDDYALSQVVVICGHNTKLYDEINSKKWPKNVKVVAKKFVQNIDEYMGAADCLITKAGPGTIAEAMIRGLPIILSSFLPGQVCVYLCVCVYICMSIYIQLYINFSFIIYLTF